MKISIASSLRIVICAAAALALHGAHAQERMPVLVDVLNLDATVSSEVAPDLAVVTLAVVREGADVAALTQDVNQTLARAFAEARSVPSVVAANAGYTTFPRYDSRGGQSTRSGWQVRAEIIVKSKDFAALGTLVGKLSTNLQIAGSSFEISPELRAREDAALIAGGARAFQEKASAAAKAFGYAGYSIRQITLGQAGQSGVPRPIPMVRGAMVAQDSAPLPIESGRVSLSLIVSGSVQMRK